MITEHDYWMGRDVAFPNDFTPAIESNGKTTVERVNMFLSIFEQATGLTTNTVASGWRPLAVNCGTANAAEHSHHIDALACDIRDDANRSLARFVAANQSHLADIGLWCERFEWTPTWVHFQRVPPASGRRFFIPSSSPAKCARLDEQDQFNC